MRRVNWICGVAMVAASACGGEAAKTPDAGEDTVTQPDTVEPGDLSISDTESEDVSGDAMTDNDAADGTPDVLADAADDAADDTVEPPGPVEAVVGLRCAETARIGTVAIERQDFPEPHFSLVVAINNAAEPSATAPTTTVGTCAYHVQPDACVAQCDWPEVCGSSGDCEAKPGPYGAFTLTAEAGGATQDFVATAESGASEGDLSLAGETFGFRLSLGDLEVVLAPMTVPAALTDVAGTLVGDYDNPERVDVTWSSGEVGAFVTTKVPINHHVGGNTFTRCDVPSEDGAMSVPGELLKPLAVSTGLEFQGIEHIRFAAATVEAGCIEFQFISRAYVPLF